MTAVRLRSAQPRYRRRGRSAPLVALGVAVVISMMAALLHGRGDVAPSLRIERLPVPVSSAPAAAREIDGALLSLPPLAPPQPYLPEHRIVAFYGNPLTEILGVLGEQDPEATIRRVQAQADAYVPYSPDKHVVPALHLIYAVAQSYPGDDGSYLLRMEDALIDEYVRLTRDNGLLLFLDVQMGRSTIAAELPHIARFLAFDHVHVGLDPEFAWGTDGRPNDDIGFMTGAQINEAQALLQRVAIEHKLPTKMLVVHQFLPGMVKDKASVRAYDRVELVFDADGVGSRTLKQGSWNRVIVADGVENAGIKLFYRHDPDLMGPADVMALEPKPAIIIYQ